ncbi:MAG: hypothetical protein HAW60_03550 [Bdellovibrionales bacterium]|nr:hypothetical protein [Bdellovibrionales bacterium]
MIKIFNILGSVAILLSSLFVQAYSYNTSKKDNNKQVEHIIEIKSFKFIPEELDAKVGDKLIFINKDSAPHSVAPKDDSYFYFKSSGVLMTNDTFEIIVDQLDISIMCGLHPRMPGFILNVFR